jgi:hypothetical protein
MDCVQVSKKSLPQIKLDDIQRKESADSLERARLAAAVNLEAVALRIGALAEEPGVTMKTLLDVAEFNYKLSGMAAKQQAQADQGSKFSLVINLPGGQTVEISGAQPKQVIENPPQGDFAVADEAFAVLDDLPPYLTAEIPVSDDLAAPVTE